MVTVVSLSHAPAALVESDKESLDRIAGDLEWTAVAVETEALLLSVIEQIVVEATIAHSAGSQCLMVEYSMV